MTDRYTKAVLTIIALALIYLCVVLTPIPGVQAQTARRPGDPTGPGEMVIVGWRAPKGETIPVSVMGTVSVTNDSQPLRITGAVSTERSSGAADRVVLVGWEENTSQKGPGRMMKSITSTEPGFPVQQKIPQK
jgi:hypothetical protein